MIFFTLPCEENQAGARVYRLSYAQNIQSTARRQELAIVEYPRLLPLTVLLHALIQTLSLSMQISTVCHS